MLLNEPTPHPIRPAAATAPAPPSARELPPVEIDGARLASAQLDTVAFAAVERDEAEGRESSEEPTAGEEAAGSDAVSTVSLNVDEVKRVAASDAAATVSLNAAAIKQVVRDSNGFAQAPTVAFVPVKADVEDGIDTEALPVEAIGDALQDTASAHADAGSREPAADVAEPDTEAETSAADAAAADSGDPSADTDPESSGIDTEPTSSSTEVVLADDSALADSTLPDTTPEETPSAYLASTDLSASTSTIVAVPTTADDVIATIHAAATAVAAADRRARQAAVVKEDPWTGLDLHRPPAPAPVDNVLDLLAPVLERPLLVVEQPGLPAASDVVALHRSELEVDFVEPPVVAAGAEPAIPPRYGPGLSVLPHIEFPV